MTDEQTIREQILRWADAAHTGDLETVLADHDPNIVQFDVPPPYRGLRGTDEYRDVWPPFFDWQRQGAALQGFRFEEGFRLQCDGAEIDQRFRVVRAQFQRAAEAGGDFGTAAAVGLGNARSNDAARSLEMTLQSASASGK